MILRLAKILFVSMVAALLLLVGIDNLLDYGTNYEFVRHVMSMDLVPQDSRLIWRAIDSPFLWHLVYALIIAGEIGAGLLCAIGAWRLCRARNLPAARFAARKDCAIAGLMLALIVYLFGFMTVAAEWFQMWQAQSFNGQEAAFRLIAIVGLALVFLCQREPELGDGSG